MRALAVALALAASPAAALECEAFLGSATLQGGDVRALPGGCSFSGLVLDTGDGGLWEVPRATVQGTGIGQSGVPLQDIELRIDNARQVLATRADSAAPALGARTTALLTATRSDTEMDVQEFIVAMTGLGQIIANGRLLDLPADFASADPAAVLGIRAERLDLTLEVESLERTFVQFDVTGGDGGITAILTDLSASLSSLDGQATNVAALDAVVAAMPDPRGRLRLRTGETPVPLALFALAIASGNAAPLVEAGLDLTWSPAR